MAIEFKLPELGEGVETADVAEIQVSEGDRIEADGTVMELETEKAVVDLPCPHAGRVAKIHVSPGETIRVGQVLLTIEEAEEGAEEKAEEEGAGEEEKEQPEAAPAEEAKEEAEPARGEKEERRGEAREPAAAPHPMTAAGKEGGRAEGDGAEALPPRAGPATRRLARKLSVNLRQLRGSGPGGRITQEDVVRAHEGAGGGQRRAAATLPTPKLPDFSKFGPVEETPLNKIAKTAIRNLTTSWQVIPHVTQQGLADITELEEERRAYMKTAEESTPKITLTAIAVKAVAGVLREFPKFNASLDAERDVLILKQYTHIGVAVDTEEGLLVPVIRDADRMGIVEIAATLNELAGKARERKLKAGEMQGATFTISNQGGIGGTSFTPIVNFPEVAILGMSKGEKRMLVVDDEPKIRLVLPLSLSYDHRVINGADAARFVERLAAILSDPSLLMFES